MISDRLSTKFDRTKEPWNKIYSVNDSTVLGLSGNSEGSRLIAQLLTNSKGPLPTGYVAAYQKFQALGPSPDEREIEAICVTKENGFIETYKFTRSLYNTVGPNFALGIGSGEAIIRPQLSRATNTVDYATAVEFGKTLIQYASMVDNAVGSPSEYGFCLAVIPAQGDVSNRILPPPQYVGVDKMLYPF